MYRSIYLLQKRWRLKHNEDIIVAYSVIMVCYPVHGPQREEWGIQSISGTTWGKVDTQVCYNWFSQYLRMFYNVLQCSMAMLQSQMLWKTCDGACDEACDCKKIGRAHV